MSGPSTASSAPEGGSSSSSSSASAAAAPATGTAPPAPAAVPFPSRVPGPHKGLRKRKRTDHVPSGEGSDDDGGGAGGAGSAAGGGDGGGVDLEAIRELRESQKVGTRVPFLLGIYEALGKLRMNGGRNGRPLGPTRRSQSLNGTRAGLPHVWQAHMLYRCLASCR